MKQKVDLCFDPFFKMVGKQVVGPLLNALGMDMTDLVKKVVLEIEGITEWYPVR